MFMRNTELVGLEAPAWLRINNQNKVRGNLRKGFIF